MGRLCALHEPINSLSEFVKKLLNIGSVLRTNFHEIHLEFICHFYTSFILDFLIAYVTFVPDQEFYYVCF